LPGRLGRNATSTAEESLSIEPDPSSRDAESLDGVAIDELFARLYDELHRVAEHALRRDGGAITVGATTLVHEAYLNVVGRREITFSERRCFLAYTARAMRGLVIDHARKRRTVRHGRHLEITLVPDEAPSDESMRATEELTQLGEALDELAALEPLLAEVVDLHFFGGFSFVEIAELRGVAERTVQRDWRKARLLLQHALLAEHVIARAP